MATMIIDGATGGKQIYPYMEAASNASLTGKMDCVPNNFDDSTKPFDPVMVSNNEISVSSGIGYLQGRRFIVDGAESVLVSNGISGAKRYTYIVAEYNATEAGIESVVLNTVDGEANGTIEQLDAQLAKGSVDTGEKYQMPLILILKNGLDIESIDIAYDSVGTLNSFDSVKDSLLNVRSINSGTFSLSANGTSEQTIKLDYAGYTPIGIVGYRGLNDTRYYPYRFTIDEQGAKVSLKNATSGALSNLYVQVQILYMKKL